MLMMGPTGSGMDSGLYPYLLFIYKLCLIDLFSFKVMLFCYLHCELPAILALSMWSTFLIFVNLAERTGKTLLAKTLARVVNVPFVIADATTLTQVGRLYFFF